MTGKRRAALAAAAILAASLAVAAWLHDARYRSAREVDHQAYPLRRIDLDPPQAPAGVEYFGTVRIDLYIGTDGRVHRAELVESTLPPAIRERFVAAFTSARWQPARLGGREVRSVKRVEVELEPPAGAKRAPMRPDS